MVVRITLVLFATIQFIYQSSATPINLEVKTVHGNVHAKECHGKQACVGDVKTEVDTIKGDLRATEYYNSRASATATASTGRRRRNIQSHQRQKRSDIILQTVNGAINGKYAPAPYDEQCLCANNQPGSWICILGRTPGPDCRCECNPFAVYEPEIVPNMRQKRSPINMNIQKVHGTTTHTQCTSANPCGDNSPTIEVNHVGGEVTNEVIVDGQVMVDGAAHEAANGVTTHHTQDSTLEASTNVETTHHTQSSTSATRFKFVSENGVSFIAHLFNNHL